DGVYYTKFGARKLAHYVEREIQRSITNRGMPVALPVPVDPGPQAPNAKPGGPAQRPLSGPVVPLTAMQTGPEELVGGRRAAPARRRRNRLARADQGRAGRRAGWTGRRFQLATRQRAQRPAGRGRSGGGTGRSRCKTSKARCRTAHLRLQRGQFDLRAETGAAAAPSLQSRECAALAVLLPKFLSIEHVRRDCG